MGPIQERNIEKRRLESGMPCRTGTHALLSMGLLFLFLFSNESGLLADNCRCCGKTYGDPMPGDEARVYRLRREHEASCCKKAATPDSRQASAINSESDDGGRQEEIGLQREAARREAGRIERERKKKEQKEFEQNKQDGLNNMKGASTLKPGLKGTVADGDLRLKNAGDSGRDSLGLKGIDRDGVSTANSGKKPQSKPEKAELGWKKALGCAMEESYARAELLGPTGERFSRDLRHEMERVFNEAGKPVRKNEDVNIVSLNIDRQVSVRNDSSERQFAVNVAVYSKPNGSVAIDVQSFYFGSAGKKDKQENVQTIIILNKSGEIVMKENSAKVDACLVR